MLDLSPTKLLIIFVVVVVLLGPKRLPEVARQLGAGWRKLRDLHGRLDSELRRTMPDLPTSQEIVRFARSPITLLNQLADHTDEPPSRADAGAAASNGISSNGTTSNGSGPRTAAPKQVPSARVSSRALDTDDPNLN